MQTFAVPYSDGSGCNPGTGQLAVTATMGTWDTTKAGANGVTLAANGSYQFTFAPGRSGDNAINFVNQSSIAQAGTLEFCWKSNSYPNWSCWATDAITNQWKRRILYSGSADVSYRLTIRAGTPATFYWRKFTAP
jgi:hypothetical protein